MKAQDHEQAVAVVNVGRGAGGAVWHCMAAWPSQAAWHIKTHAAAAAPAAACFAAHAFCAQGLAERQKGGVVSLYY